MNVGRLISQFVIRRQTNIKAEMDVLKNTVKALAGIKKRRQSVEEICGVPERRDKENKM